MLTVLSCRRTLMSLRGMVALMSSMLSTPGIAAWKMDDGVGAGLAAGVAAAGSWLSASLDKAVMPSRRSRNSET